MITILSGPLTFSPFFGALRAFWISLRLASSMSVRIVRSCASSTTMTLYRRNIGSTSSSRTSIPSVTNLILVCDEDLSSKRTEYPTRSPILQPCSRATRCARDVAATRRGWVTAIAPGLAMPASSRNCGTSATSSDQIQLAMYAYLRVVLPLPVSPSMTTVSFALISRTSASLPADRGQVLSRTQTPTIAYQTK